MVRPVTGVPSMEGDAPTITLNADLLEVQKRVAIASILVKMAGERSLEHAQKEMAAMKAQERIHENIGEIDLMNTA